MIWTASQFSSSFPQEKWESFIDHYVASGMLIGAFLISLCYPIFHALLTKYSNSYESLPSSQQTVVVQHSIQGALLFLLWAPMTYLYLSLYFQEQSLDVFQQKFRLYVTMVFIIIILYTIEIATRFDNLRPVVIAHHLCAIGNAVYSSIALTTANIKSSSVLMYFVTFEAPTFVGLLMYRLRPMDKRTPGMILIGIFVMGVSRPLQVTLILASLLVSWDDLVLWHASVQIILTIIFTSLQLYSISIHWAMRRKCLEKQAAKQIDAVDEKQFQVV